MVIINYNTLRLPGGSYVVVHSFMDSRPNCMLLRGWWNSHMEQPGSVAHESDAEVHKRQCYCVEWVDIVRTTSYESELGERAGIGE